jgi:signal transduction histidine kinase/ActR/RegA family two-component response regulator/HAMP domain-containing protein
MIKRFFKFSTVRMKLVGSVLLLIVPSLLFMYIYDLPMSGFVVGGLALVAAWMGGEFFVRRQVQAMTQTAQKIADGNLDARTGLPASGDELGQMANIVDRMAESLQQRNAERERTEGILLNRALEQTVVAALGQFALTSNDLDALLNQAVILVGQTLDVEFAAVFERLPDGQLLLQVGTGWNSEHIGHTKLPGDNATQIGFTLNSGEPAVTTDSKTETRFTTSPFLTGYGVVSNMTVAIPTRGESFGVLGVHTARRREFIADETQFLIAVAGCIGMAADHLNLEEQLRQSQKMESVGQLAAGVAHDFNNMLTIIQGHSSALLAKPSLPSEMLEPVQAVFFAAERAAGLTRQLLMFSRKNVMQSQPLDLRETVGNMTKLLGRLLGETVTLEFQSPAELPSVQGDPGMIEQVVMNLAVNARDAMPRGGTLTIGIEPMAIDAAYTERRPDARAGYFLRLRVADTGTGMDAATLSRIFEPFFTTKDVGKGTGLGLATVYGIVKQHDGWLEVNSEPGKGTTFDVFFPAGEENAVLERKEIATTGPVVGGTETILIVEDEEILREMARDILKDCGYRILEASTGRQALEVWNNQSAGEIDLLLTDMVMPEGMSGVDLAEWLLADRPDLKIIFTSGYSSTEVGEELLSRSQARFLQKPYSHTTLARAVRDCLDLNASANVSKTA